MICKQCGTQLPDVARFCFNCGVSMDDTESGSRGSAQTERVLYDFPLEKGATFYTGEGRFVFNCHCTLTDLRLIIRCENGGTQQVLIREISNVTPENTFFGGKNVRIGLGSSASLQLHCETKEETFEITSWIEEAMTSQIF